MPDKPGFSRHMQEDPSRREADVLANMLGADSRRIDSLVTDVGEVKGDVRGMRGDIGRVTEGVDELRGAMTVLSRHSVLMEQASTSIGALTARVDAHEKRIHDIEVQQPGLLEARRWTVQGVLGVVGLVLAAVLALVLKR